MIQKVKAIGEQVEKCVHADFLHAWYNTYMTLPKGLFQCGETLQRPIKKIRILPCISRNI